MLVASSVFREVAAAECAQPRPAGHPAGSSLPTLIQDRTDDEMREMAVEFADEVVAALQGTGTP